MPLLFAFNSRMGSTPAYTPAACLPAVLAHRFLCLHTDRPLSPAFKWRAMNLRLHTIRRLRIIAQIRAPQNAVMDYLAFYAVRL